MNKKKITKAEALKLPMLPDGSFTCSCGNSEDHDSFYPIDAYGERTPMDSSWSGLFRCEVCGLKYHYSVHLNLD